VSILIIEYNILIITIIGISFKFLRNNSFKSPKHLVNFFSVNKCFNIFSITGNKSSEELLLVFMLEVLFWFISVF